MRVARRPGVLDHTTIVGVVRGDADTLDSFGDLADAHHLGEGSPHVVALPVELLGQNPAKLSQQRR
jgi:hypothetical protein